MSILKNSLYLSHDFIKMVVKPGDVVLDATAGNGNDTLFLAKLVGDKGRVYSFDIQEKAIEKSKTVLQMNGFLERAVFINDGHQNIDKYIIHPINAAMFNLGYLPGGDHSLGTKPHTTIQALKKTMEMLVPKGLITLVVYHGGDSGFEEKNAIIEFINSICSKEFKVLKCEYTNQMNCPPILICIEKNNKQ